VQKSSPKSRSFFGIALRQFSESGIPFLVGGGYAMKRHTGLGRPARDLDLLVLPEDVDRALRYFAALDYQVELTFPHWLGKIYMGRAYVDIIFSSGNGLVTVDRDWFDHAVDDTVLGQPVSICPAEEMIWSKAFVMERERYDGADVNHLILAKGREMDWDRLLRRFQPHPLVLLSHLTLFLFVYPAQSQLIPRAVWDELLEKLEEERRNAADSGLVCRGPLLSRSQYLDALDRGYPDPRLEPEGKMRQRDVAIWTKAAVEENEGQ
jgi:hypothetical protein